MFGATLKHGVYSFQLNVIDKRYFYDYNSDRRYRLNRFDIHCVQITMNVPESEVVLTENSF